MKLQSLEDVFLEGLQYAYDAELQLTEALPKMAKAATTPQLRDAFEAHLQETREHVNRVAEIFTAFGKQPHGKNNTVIEAMTKETEGMVKQIDASALLDTALIMAANQVEHFEMACYGSLKSFAQLLGKYEVVKLLDQTLNEEKKAAATVIEVGEQYVYQPAAVQAVTAGAR